MYAELSDKDKLDSQLRAADKQIDDMEYDVAVLKTEDLVMVPMGDGKVGQAAAVIPCLKVPRSLEQKCLQSLAQAGAVLRGLKHLDPSQFGQREYLFHYTIGRAAAFQSDENYALWLRQNRASNGGVAMFAMEEKY